MSDRCHIFKVQKLVEMSDVVQYCPSIYYKGMYEGGNFQLIECRTCMLKLLLQRRAPHLPECCSHFFSFTLSWRSLSHIRSTNQSINKSKEMITKVRVMVFTWEEGKSLILRKRHTRTSQVLVMFLFLHINGVFHEWLFCNYSLHYT